MVNENGIQKCNSFESKSWLKCHTVRISYRPEANILEGDEQMIN